MLRVSYSPKPVDFSVISMSMLKLFETEVIKAKVVFKMSTEAHQFAIFWKYYKSAEVLKPIMKTRKVNDKR